MHARSEEWKQSLCSLITWLAPLHTTWPSFPLIATIFFTNNCSLQPYHVLFPSSVSVPASLPCICPHGFPSQASRAAGPGPQPSMLAARPALTCECTALCCSRLTAWPKVLPHMSQAKGLVPLCERRTCTSRPCGVEKTWAKRVHRVKFAREKGLREGHTQCGREGSLPCCTWHTCKSQCWWAVGGTRGRTPLWYHLAPSPAAAQVVFQHRVQELLPAAAQTAPGPGSWSHRTVPGKSYTRRHRGRARSLGHRRAPGLRSAPASGRACSSAQGAWAQSHPGCSTCRVWRAPRKGVLHLGMDTQISPRLWKHKAWELVGFTTQTLS